MVRFARAESTASRASVRSMSF